MSGVCYWSYTKVSLALRISVLLCSYSSFIMYTVIIIIVIYIMYTVIIVIYMLFHSHILSTQSYMLSVCLLTL